MRSIKALLILLLACPSWAAVSCATALSGFNNTGNASQATASFTPGTNHLILLAVRTRLATGNGATLPTVTGNSLTWVQAATKGFGGVVGTGNGQRLTVFRTLGGSPSTGAATIDFGGITQAEQQWTAIDCSGTDTTGSNGANAVADITSNGTTVATSSPSTVTMGTFTNAASQTYAASAITVAATSQTAGTSMTRINNGTGGGNGSLADEWSNGNNNVSPATMTWTGSNNWAIIGIEIVPPSAGVTAAKHRGIVR